MDWKRRSDQPQSRYEPDEGDTFEEADVIDASRYQRHQADFVDASSYQRESEQRATAPTTQHASYDQTAVDPVFAERGRIRRERQGASFNTQRFGGGGTRGGRRGFSLPLVLIPIALVALLIVGLLWFLNGRGGNTTAIGPSSSPTVVVNRSPSPSPSASPSPSVSPSPSASPSPSSSAATTYVVTGTDTDGVFVRQAASASSPKIATLPEGTQVQVTGVTANADGREWRQIRAPQEGWVAAEFLKPVP